MLEVDPTFASDKPRVVVKPLGIGGREDPARLIFNGCAGKGTVLYQCLILEHIIA
jgi:L-arabinose isomerase